MHTGLEPSRRSNHFIQLDSVEDIPQGTVTVLRPGVKVTPDGAAEEHWVLRDDGQLRSESIQADGGYVDAIEVDGSRGHWDQPVWI
jgi:hypothetical protein